MRTNVPHGVKTYCPPLPEYGSHHSKGMICFFDSNHGQSNHHGNNEKTNEICEECGETGCGRPQGEYVCVIITTANFVPGELSQKTNGIWSCCFPLKSSSESSSSKSTCEFEEDLVRYFNQYNKRASSSHRGKGQGKGQSAHVVDVSRLRNYDYSHLK